MNQNIAGYIKEHIREYLPEDYREAEVTLHRTVKNNDQVLTGLIIRKEDEMSAPAIYLDGFAEQFDAGRPMDSIMREIAQIQTETGKPLPFEIPQFTDYGKIRPMLAIRMCDPENNREYLQGKPYTVCGELAATYRVQVMENGNETAAAVVTDNIMRAWGITVEQLHRDAVEAVNERNPVCLYHMEALMDSLAYGGDCPNLLDSGEMPLRDFSFLYVLTNQTKTDGAAALVRDDVLEKVGSLLEANYYVLPSSVHEVLVVPDNGAMSLTELEKMVKDINEAQVGPKDMLSNKVQYYDRDARTLTRKQEKGVLERLAEHKEQIRKMDAKQPKEKQQARNETSL